jgi:hypothetical protein
MGITMKKTLYSTTALAAAGLLTLGASDAFAQAAAPAAPEKLKLTLGGFMNQYIGYVDQDNAASTTHLKHFDQKSDSEVYFTGSVKLDNGITASVVIQLEADTGTTENFDESYLRLDTDLGQFRLGQSDAASLALSVEGPYVGINFYNGDQATWIVNPTTNVAGIGSTTIGGGDDNRVYYITPAIAGFRAGASYAASTSENLQTQPLVTETDITDVALQWAGKVSDFGIRAGTSYWWTEGSSSTASASARNWQVGGDVTFADFTLGSGWSRKSARDGDTSGADVTSWNIGLVYKPGPWSVGLTHARGDAEGSRAIGGDDEARRWNLGATYAIGPGVTALGQVLYHRYNDEANVATSENKGVAVIGGIQLAF